MAVAVTVTVVIVTAAAPIDDAPLYSSGPEARGDVTGNFFLIQEHRNLYLTRSSARALASSVAVVFGSCTRFLLRP